jgi:hypothetical protein
LEGATLGKRAYSSGKGSTIHPSELPVELKEIPIGVLLGDLHCQRRSPTGNTRLLFEQGEIHKEYLLHTFDHFQSYCGVPPRFSRRLDKRTGKVYYSGRFSTLSLPLFNYSYDLCGKGKEAPGYNQLITHS